MDHRDRRYGGGNPGRKMPSRRDRRAASADGRDTVACGRSGGCPTGRRPGSSRRRPSRQATSPMPAPAPPGRPQQVTPVSGSHPKAPASSSHQACTTALPRVPAPVAVSAAPASPPRCPASPLRRPPARSGARPDMRPWPAKRGPAHRGLQGVAREREGGLVTVALPSRASHWTRVGTEPAVAVAAGTPSAPTPASRSGRRIALPRHWTRLTAKSAALTSRPAGSAATRRSPGSTPRRAACTR